MLEPTGTIERVFTVTFRSTGKNVNMNRLHHGLVEKIFEAVPGIVFRPTSNATTKNKRAMTTIEQFPTTEIAHGNFFERRQKGKTIEVDHKIHSAVSVKEIKNKIMSYIRPNNIFLEKGELDGVELFRFGYLQGAHPVWSTGSHLKIELTMAYGTSISSTNTGNSTPLNGKNQTTFPWYQSTKKRSDGVREIPALPANV